MRVLESEFLGCSIVKVNGNYQVTHNESKKGIKVVTKEDAYTVAYLLELEYITKKSLEENKEKEKEINQALETAEVQKVVELELEELETSEQAQSKELE